MMIERFKFWNPRVVVAKYNLDQVEWASRRLEVDQPKARDFQLLGIEPEQEVELSGNLVTTLGKNRAASLLAGSGGQAMVTNATRIGVGDSTTTPATAADTDLFAAAGSTHRWFSPCDSVSVTDNVLTLIATFGTADANFAWNEYGFDIGAPTVSAGSTVNTLFSHKVGTGGTLGTKTSTYAWAFTSYATVG